MKLDIKKLKADISSVTNQIRFLRANGVYSIYSGEVTRTWAEFLKHPSENTRKAYLDASRLSNDYSLAELKKKATILCSIKAQNRQKLHRQKIRNPYCTVEGQPQYLQLSMDDQAKLIAPYMVKYVKEEKEIERKAQG